MVFLSAHLNCTEILLWRTDDGIALTASNETGHRRRIPIVSCENWYANSLQPSNSIAFIPGTESQVRPLTFFSVLKMSISYAP